MDHARGTFSVTASHPHGAGGDVAPSLTNSRAEEFPAADPFLAKEPGAPGKSLHRRDLLRGGAAGGLVVLLGGTAWLGGGRRPPLSRLALPAMGTMAEILVAHPAPAGPALARAAMEEILAVEQRMTRFDPASEVGRVNAHPGRSFPISPMTTRVMEAALELWRASDGRFHPALGSLGELWGFVGHPSSGRVPSADQISEAVRAAGPVPAELLPDKGGAHLRIARGGGHLDLGAIAKGYAVDRAVALLRANDVRHALVNVGGDLYALGTHPEGRPWQVGIRHPRSQGKFLAVLSLTNRGVATSGDYERFFMADGHRYHHLLEPGTGRPAPYHQSATVTAGTVMEADALATAAFTSPPALARRLLKRISPGRWMTVDGRGAISRA